jgi:hypothetical protein
MRNRLLFSALIVCLLCTPKVSLAQSRIPKPSELKLVAQLPAELPQRIMGLAYDGEKFWATIYLGRGSYATLDRATLTWNTNQSIEHYSAISKVAGVFESPGGLCFAQGKLWITGAYGESFGSINTQTWKVEQIFKGKQREDSASQSYASVACDGHHLWIAWHWFRYDLPVSETQLLLKVNPESGKVVDQYPFAGGTRNDITHGLTWDGASLWHIKDNRLSSIEPSSGKVTAQYVLDDLKRPSGLAWANDALWIAEFDGKVWRLPFK